MERKMGLLLLAAAFSTAVFTRMAAFTVVPAIYAFGDSTTDANFPPYGIDFRRSRPTGRYSNGYLVVDYMAKKLNFNKSPPAYLSISNDAQANRGVNFASGDRGQNFSISLNQQIKYFKGITRRLRTRIGGRAAHCFLSKSLFVFSTGSNDMFRFYVNFGLKNETQQQLFIGQLTGQFRNQLETLYDLGARKFAVFGSSLIGCVPILRLGVPGAKCVEDLNNLSQQFNRATQIVLRDHASTLKVSPIPSSTPTTSSPLFTDIVSACCGSGRLNAESECRPNSTYCFNRDEYIYWDRVHPTQATYRLIALTAYRGRRYASPVTIKQLVGL
ncbi:unnamed protein product [Spirodela intermedia]|uniref:Uncharacterized protein n=1 Tax=Spirodela intermedia TaxID=51605 RepID=A0A7I8IE43_SPIIN|nr:unnamed protein product [Spirodela intermedia]CAA6656056.1 unnamed protein product [Spirodela intermedia]